MDSASSLVPGGNPSGGNMTVPSPAGSSTPAIGGGTNPFLPTFPAGQSTPPQTSPINAAAPANSATSTTTSATPPGAAGPAPAGGLTGQNLANNLGLGGSQGFAGNQNDFVKAMHKAGFSAGDAALLYDFLKSGAGFNQDVINQLFASMQPQIQRGQENIMEQFSGMGLRGGSPAGVAEGDYMAQVNLNEGQIEASMYEQSVQNYMNVLMAGKGSPPAGTFQNILSYMNAAANVATGAGKAAEGFAA